MPANKSRRVAAAILIAFAAPGAAFAQNSVMSQEEAACEGDAFEFCSQYIPNRGQIRDCLYEYRNEISPACRALVAPNDR